MTTRIAAPVIATVSLALLMSGCAGAAAAGGGVRDDLRPAENAAAMGLARGHVVVRDDLSPTRVQNRITAQSVEDAVSSEVHAPWTAEVPRELHAQPGTSAETFTGTTFSADALRELKGNAPAGRSAAEVQGDRLRAYAEARAAAEVSPAEMQGERLRGQAEARSDAAIRELKGSRTVQIDIDDDLSPLGGPR